MTPSASAPPAPPSSPPARWPPAPTTPPAAPTPAPAPADASAPPTGDDHGRRPEQADLPAVHARQAARLLRQGRRQRQADRRARRRRRRRRTCSPGRSQGVGGFYDHNIALQAQGKSVRVRRLDARRSPARSSCAAATSRARSSRPADFKGTSLGITDTGSSTDFLTQYLSDQERRRPRQRRPVAASAPGRRSSPR